MSKHNIHGLTVNVEVLQGNLTNVARGRCVGKVVNLCREMGAEDFKAAMADTGSAAHAAMLETIDSELEAGYTKRFADEFAPIARLDLA